MTHLVTTEFAEPGTRFAQDMFDSQIGKEIPFKVGDEQRGTCELLGYDVSEDGTFVTMTFQVPDDVFGPGLDSVLGRPGQVSIAEAPSE